MNCGAVMADSLDSWRQTECDTDRVDTEPSRHPTGNSWTWDATLYAGSAPYYAVGRVAYPPTMVELLAQRLQLTSSGVLLDVGCGPGSLTLLLAPCFADAIGIDADPDMLVEASRLANAHDVRNVTWRHLRAEDLPADLPRVRMVTFAQSFHWMNGAHVAEAVRSMLLPGGVLVHVAATTHEGVETGGDLPRPRPPWDAIGRLIARYLGPQRRAGQGVLLNGTSSADEDDIFCRAGFRGPEHLDVPGRAVERTADEIAAAVYSLSSSAPHLFGEALPGFDRQLRGLLRAASDNGRFSELMRSITLSIWR